MSVWHGFTNFIQIGREDAKQMVILELSFVILFSRLVIIANKNYWIILM